MRGKADQFRFETSRSRRSKKKTDHKAEHQNRYGGDNQSRNQRSKHGQKPIANSQKRRAANSESPTVSALFSRKVPGYEDHSMRECKSQFDLE